MNFMKNTNVAKTVGVITASLLVTGCVSTCSSADKVQQQEQTEPIVETIEEPPKQELKPAEPPKKVEPEKKESKPKLEKKEIKPEAKKEEKKEAVQEQPVKNIQNPLPEQNVKKEETVSVEKKEEEVVDEEYSRSIEQITDGSKITHETFSADKKAVLELIENLKEVMSKQNYNEWIKYLDEESIKYWSQKSNLQKAQKRLPVKGLKISSLQDYFKYVFIPSRTGKDVDEIRYLSDSLVKVVQIRKDAEGRYVGDTVYYNLRKINGEWKVHLPEL
ncbi:MAG: hypothetical protein K6G00_00720 [Treponema sp.]|nr:hypothetical protein [Treponema sp.]